MMDPALPSAAPNPLQSSVPYSSYEPAQTIRLTAEDKQKLRQLAAFLGVSENEAIRKAIADAWFIRNQIVHGSKIVLADQGGKTLREIQFR